MARLHGIAVALSVALLGPLVPGAGSSMPPAPAREVLRVDLDYITGPVGSPVTIVTVVGSAQVTGAIVQSYGGVVTAASARQDQGDAVSLPAFGAAATTPRAALRIANATAIDELSPGLADFSFGADFVLDAVSALPGATDNGDNLVQRGLFSDRDQYKLQLDGHRPSCRLQGRIGVSTASILVTSPVRVDSSHWYRAECIRSGRTLTVSVRRFNEDGTVDTTTTSKTSSAVLKVAMKLSTVPLSIGGKLNPNGTLATDSDQFNGRVDNAFLSLG